MTTAERLNKLIRDHFGADPAKLPQPVNLVRDLKLDSLDLVELVMAIEEEFCVEISDDEAEPFVSDDGETAPHALSELVALIDRKVGER